MQSPRTSESSASVDETLAADASAVDTVDGGSHASEPRARDAAMPSAAAVRDAGIAEEKPSEAQHAGAVQPTVTEAFEWPADCEERHVFRAHGAPGADDASKYRVPAGQQWFATFYFKSPWAGDMHLLQTRSTIDNPKIVHHWTLSVTQTDQALDGVIRDRADQRPELLGGELPLISGAPGGWDMKLPPEIGLRMTGGSNLLFELEIHYFNGAGARDEEDGSSIEVCVTHRKRPIEAAIHTLGRNSFTLPAHQRTDVATTCVPEGQVDPIHLMNATPHKHRTGVRAQLMLNRKSCERVALHDGPYSFLEQRSIQLPADGSAPDVILNPGDTLTTTCTYDNPRDEAIPQGNQSQNEMCEMAVLAWPAGALHNQYAKFIGLIPGQERFADVICMDP